MPLLCACSASSHTCCTPATWTPEQEMLTFEKQLQRTTSVPVFSMDAAAASASQRGDPNDPASFQGRVKSALTKVRGLISRGKKTQSTA